MSAPTPIQVYLRVRPNNHAEGMERCLEISKDQQSVILNAPPGTQPGFTAALRNSTRQSTQPNTQAPSVTSTQQNTFHFDSIFPSSTDQYSVYETVALPLLDDLMKGYNATVMAFGQTSSGKTHTLLGAGPLNEPESISPSSAHGLIPRTIAGIFDLIDSADEAIDFTLKVSVIEIYNEKIRDLLSQKDNLKLRDSNDHVWIEDLTQVYVTTIEDMFTTISVGQNNRTTTSTLMNDQSSRSHLVIRITIGQENTDTGEKRGATLSYVDLAGSERVLKTQVEGTSLKEAQHINKSLSALGNVINACASNLPHIPFRDSVITHLLRESIGGSAKTRIILTCSPSPIHHEESLSTCRFGQRASMIKNKPTINRERSIEEYKILLLNIFRIIVRRNALLGAAFHAIDTCVESHQQQEDSAEMIYTTHNDLLPIPPTTILSPEHPLYIPGSIKDVIQELCDQRKDLDLIKFINENGAYKYDPNSTIIPSNIHMHKSVDSVLSPMASSQTALFSSLGQADLSVAVGTLVSGGANPGAVLAVANDEAREAMKEEIAILEGKLTMFQERNTQMIEQMKSMETSFGLKMLDTTNELEGKEQAMVRLRTEITDQYIQHQVLNDTIEKLENTVKSLENEQERTASTISSLNLQLEKFTTLLRQKDNTIKSLCDENSSQQEAQLKQHNELLFKIEKLNKIAKDKEVSYKDAENQLGQHNQEVTELQEIVAKLKQEQHTMTATHTSLSQQHQQAKTELLAKIEENNILSQQLKDKNQALELSKKHITELKKTISELTERISAHREENSQSEERYKALDSEYTQYRANLELNRDERSLLQDIQCQNIELQKLLTAAQHEQNLFKQQMFDVGDKYREANQSTIELQQTVKTLTNRLHDNDMILNDRTARLTKFDQEVKALIAERDAAIAERDEFQLKMAEVEQAHENAQEQYSQLDIEYKSKDEYTTLLKQECAELQLRISTLEKDLTENTVNYQSTVETTQSLLDAEIAQLKASIVQKENIIVKNTNELNELKNTNTLQQQQINKLKDDYIKTSMNQQELTAKITEYEQRLSALQAQYTSLQQKYKKLEENSETRFIGFEREKHHAEYIYHQLCDEHAKLKHKSSDDALTVQKNQSIIQDLTSQLELMKGKYDTTSLKYDSIHIELAEQTMVLNEMANSFETHKRDARITKDNLEKENLDLRNALQTATQQFSVDQQALQASNSEHELIVADLHAQVEALTNQLKTKNAKIDQLNQNIVEITDNSNNQNKTLQDECNQIKTQLNNLNTHQNAIHAKYADETTILSKKIENIKNDKDQVEKVHAAWREQHEQLFTEKCNHYNITIQSWEEKSTLQLTEIAKLRQEIDQTKHDMNLLLSEQNKQYSMDLLDLRKAHHTELNAVNNDKNELFIKNTELELHCTQLQDLNTLQKQEVSVIEAKLKKSEETVASLQIQWEFNIVQQIQYEEVVQKRIDILEKQLRSHNIEPIHPDDVDSHEAIQAASTENNKKGGGFFGFGGPSKDSKDNVNFLKQEVKQLQQDLEQVKSVSEKKDKQYTRINNNYIDKCKEFEELMQQYDALQQTYADAKFEIDEVQKLFENPAEVEKLREQNKVLTAKFTKLQEANKQLLLNEYNARKRANNTVVTPNHGNSRSAKAAILTVDLAASGNGEPTVVVDGSEDDWNPDNYATTRRNRNLGPDDEPAQLLSIFDQTNDSHLQARLTSNKDTGMGKFF